MFSAGDLLLTTTRYGKQLKPEVTNHCTDSVLGSNPRYIGVEDEEDAILVCM